MQAIQRHVTVGDSKTEGGQGRLIPLNQEAFTALAEWRAKFDNPRPDHFLFPTERYGFDGEDGHKAGKIVAYHVDPARPIGSWKVAWSDCRGKAKVSCRLHDLRHTFVSRLGAAKGGRLDADSAIGLDEPQNAGTLLAHQERRKAPSRGAALARQNGTAVPTKSPTARRLSGDCHSVSN